MATSTSSPLRVDTRRTLPARVGSAIRIACGARALFSSTSLLLATSLSAAQGTKLSAPFRGGIGEVYDFLISPDAGRVAYLANPEKQGVSELFSASIDGRSTPIDLVEEPFDNGEPYYLQLAFTADGSRLVYLSQEEQAPELYSVPTTGRQAPLELNAHLPPGGAVLEFDLGPAGLVVYRASQETAGVPELFSVPADGRKPPVKLNASLAPGHHVRRCRITPDGGRVLYHVGQEFEFVGLFTVPIRGGSAAVELPASPSTFEVSADGTTILFQADLGGGAELYGMPADGSASPFALSGPVPGGVVASFEFSPDARRVVYRADREQDYGHELFSVPADGSSAPVELSAPVQPLQGVSVALISPDSSRVVYAIRSLSIFQPEHTQLISVPIDGSSAAIPLTPALVSGGVITEFKIDARSERVVYRASQEQPGVFELFSVPVDGGAGPVKLNGPLVPGGDVGYQFSYSSCAGFEITPDGMQVVYHADQEIARVHELYLVPIDRSAVPRRLSGPSPSGSGVLIRSYERTFEIAPDSRRVVYLSNQDHANVTELYASSLEPPARSTAWAGRE